MRRVIRAFACAIGWFAACCGPAVAAPANGQLAAVVDGRLVAFNPDSSGLRILPVTDAGQITELVFSPRGNRLAFVKAGELGVLELTTGRTLAVTSGERDANPAWTPDGTMLAFRRGARTYRVTAATGATPEPDLIGLLAGTTDLAWAPGLKAFAPVIDGRLVLPGTLDLPPAVTGVPAWAPDDSAVAYARDGGLSSIPTTGGAAKPVLDGPAGSPRWSPDATSLVFAAGAEVRTVAAAGGAPRTLLTGAERVGPVDWQPCVAEATVSCESVAPPRCSATTATATTQSDQPVDLPAPPCSDPAARPLELVVARAPDHGSLAGLRYTPAAGFAGQDSVAYRVSNGVAESDIYRVTIFVVPRPLTAVPLPGVRPPVLVQGAPFLSARATPRLDRKRTARVSVSCDQDCSLVVRLSAKLRTNKTFDGSQVKRTLVATRVVSLRLRLPSKPRGTLKTVWVTGRVRNAAGDVRSVRLPVRLPR